MFSPGKEDQPDKKTVKQEFEKWSSGTADVRREKPMSTEIEKDIAAASGKDLSAVAKKHGKPIQSIRNASASALKEDQFFADGKPIFSMAKNSEQFFSMLRRGKPIQPAWSASAKNPKNPFFTDRKWIHKSTKESKKTDEQRFAEIFYENHVEDAKTFAGKCGKQLPPQPPLPNGVRDILFIKPLREKLALWIDGDCPLSDAVEMKDVLDQLREETEHLQNGEFKNEWKKFLDGFDMENIDQGVYKITVIYPAFDKLIEWKEAGWPKEPCGDVIGAAEAKSLVPTIRAHYSLYPLKETHHLLEEFVSDLIGDDLIEPDDWVSACSEDGASVSEDFEGSL